MAEMKKWNEIDWSNLSDRVKKCLAIKYNQCAANEKLSQAPVQMSSPALQRKKQKRDKSSLSPAMQKFLGGSTAKYQALDQKIEVREPQYDDLIEYSDGKVFLLAHLKNEDVKPLYRTVQGNKTIIMVADGMGGTGKDKVLKTIKGFEREVTKAFLASRGLKKHFRHYIKHGREISESIDTLQRKNIYEQLKYPDAGKGGYSTTMALVEITENPFTYSIDIYWAGDSKVYILYADGSVSVTQDHSVDYLQRSSALTKSISDRRGNKIEFEELDVEKEDLHGILLMSDGIKNSLRFDVLPSELLFDIFDNANTANLFDILEQYRPEVNQRDDISFAKFKPDR